MIDFYTVVFKKSDPYVVALCLENGIVGQGLTQQEASDKLKEAIDSVESVKETDSNIYSAPLSIRELHEFLTIEEKKTMPSQHYELAAIHA